MGQKFQASKSSNSSQMIEMRIHRPAPYSNAGTQTLPAAPSPPQNSTEGNTSLIVNKIITQKLRNTNRSPCRILNVLISTNNPGQPPGNKSSKGKEEKPTEIPSRESRSLNSFVKTNEAVDRGCIKYKLYRPNFGGCFNIYRRC